MTNTKFGMRWKACLMSILFVSLYLPIVGIAITIVDNTEYVYAFKLVLFFGLPAYLVYSLIGWLFIGMPAHLILEKYTESRFIYYLVFSLSLCILIGVFFGKRTIFVFGIPIVLQATIFWFYFKKYTAELSLIKST